MTAISFRTGDWVVYRKTKFSAVPGPRAQNVTPSPAGEEYSYQVDKYWIVAEVLADGNLVLATRRGKQHIVSPNDPNLRRPNLWERLMRRNRFDRQVAASC